MFHHRRWRASLVRRHLECLYAIDLLAVDAQRFPTGREHARCRVSADDCLRESRRRVDHMLAIVEHQQQGAARGGSRDPPRRDVADAEIEPDRGGRRGRH